MEDDLKPYTSSSEELPQYVRRRNVVPDVPEDVDFLMDNLNDPNLDLKHRMGKPISSESFKEGKHYASSDDDVESSDRYSTSSRAGSRNSTAIEFDEYAVLSYLALPVS
jgi:hypothetical protein